MTTRGPIIAYFLGGPWDLTKRQLAVEQESIEFRSEPRDVSIADVHPSAADKPLIGRHVYLRALQLPKTFKVHEERAVVYAYWGAS